MRNYISFVVLAVVLAWLQGGAQVVNSIGEENLKVPQGMKPQTQKAEKPYVADLDTETPYFQYIDSAQTYIYSHDWPMAEQWLMKAFKTDPDNPSNSMVLSNIATLQRYQGKLADAVKNYSLALDMTPHAVTLLLNRAALYIEMDSTQRAIDDYERVCELDLYNTEARYSLGVLAMERGDTKRAEDLFNEIKRINPNSGLYHEGMGLLHKRNGNHARAAELFTQVIKVQPSAQLLGHRADCYLAMKRLNDAEADIRTALEMTPDDPYLYLLRAKLNKLRFQRDDMNRDIDTAVSLGLSRDYINQALNEEK
ncbi:MAG: tetratricopeptide repeat protein [Muribaculaceae bacterium]|nr:tetratricopeptide repeat protein [Muribaculaceae bacterium]